MASNKMVLMMKAFFLLCLFAFPETQARTLPERLRVRLFKSKSAENTLLMIITGYEEILSKPYLSKGETAVSDFGRRGASPPPPPKPATPNHPKLTSYEEILSKPYSSKGETAVSDFGRPGALPPPTPKPATPQHPRLVASAENEGLDLGHSSS